MPVVDRIVILCYIPTPLLGNLRHFDFLAAKAPFVPLFHVPGDVLSNEAPETGELEGADWDVVLDRLKVGRDEALSSKGSRWIGGASRCTKLLRLVEQLEEPLGSGVLVGIQ